MSHGPRHRRRGAARSLVAVLTVAVLAVVAGCASIPTSGPVRTGDVALSNPEPAVPLANDPPQDGTPLEIVSGFLLAGAAGLGDDFTVARKFLTPQAATRWDPVARVLVYPLLGGGPEITVSADGPAVVDVPVQGSLDRNGVYTEAPSGAHEQLALTLTRTSENQWRISGLDDVVLISASDFDNEYRAVPLYFVSMDGTQLVPDLRWLPAARIEVYAVRAMLAGPSSWLRDAVRTGVPEGSRLGTQAVTLTADRVALVDLAGGAAGADEDQRNLVLAQLTATLERLPGTAVSDVVVSVAGGLPWVSTATSVPGRDVAQTSGPFGLSGGRLVELVDGEVVPVAGVTALPGGTRSPAVSLDETIRVALAAPGLLVRLPSDGAAPVPLLSGAQLIAPSTDRYTWVWSGEATSAGTLTAVGADGSTVRVAADWLAGLTIRSISVSRDGARIAVVHTGATDGRVEVDVAAIVRDAGGRPQRLGDRFQVGASVEGAVQVAWSDEVTLAVLGRRGTVNALVVNKVPVGGPTSSLPLVDGTVGLAAGLGDRALYVVDAAGVLFSRQGATWVEVVGGMADPTFPG